MSPCLDDLVRDPARAGLLSSEERQALLAQVVELLSTCLDLFTSLTHHRSAWGSRLVLDAQ